MQIALENVFLFQILPHRPANVYMDTTGSNWVEFCLSNTNERSTQYHAFYLERDSRA